MTRILFWIVVGFVAMFALRLVNIAKAKRRARDAAGEAPRDPRPQTMVRCTRCGVYLPRADAVAGPTGLVCGGAGCTGRS